MINKKDKLKTYRNLYIVLLCFFLFWAYIFIDRGRLTIENYKSITGVITDIGHDCLLGKSNTKTYCIFFKLDNYPQRLAITTDENFKPLFDSNFPGLSIRDTVNVRFLSDYIRDLSDINLNVGEIERKNQVLYNNIHDSIWNRQMKIGLVSLLISLVFLIMIIKQIIKIKNAR